MFIKSFLIEIPSGLKKKLQRSSKYYNIKKKKKKYEEIPRRKVKMFANN